MKARAVEDYLRATLSLPQFPWEPVSSYHECRDGRPLDGDNLMLILNRGSVRSPLIGRLFVLAGYRRLQGGNFPERDVELWKLIDGIQSQKNSIFEACITHTARTLFSS